MMHKNISLSPFVLYDAVVLFFVQNSVSEALVRESAHSFPSIFRADGDSICNAMDGDNQ